MPQITINSSNITTFGYSATFNPLSQTILFDTAPFTTYNDVSGQGSLYVLGICFSVIDQSGAVLASVDWDNPQIKPALGQTAYTLDLSAIGIDFFFQTYSVIAYIKDGDGQVYSIPKINKKVCQPVGMTDNGYVVGNFQLNANCNTNVLTAKELTVLVYNNEIPDSVVKDGTLYYPTGTISPITFTGTPFTNNEIISGQYRITCDTVATYAIGDDYYVEVTYTTDEVFDVTCSNKIEDVLCCIIDIQNRAIKNANTVIGQQAEQQLASIAFPLMIGLTEQSFGRDASEQVAYIRKTLRCNCGVNALIRNEFNPINGSISNIVINGAGGTTVAAPVINGSTKTYTVKSSIYQVVKGVPSDTAFTITTDTSTPNVVKYLIAFNYTVMAQTIMSTIGGNSALLTQFNSLVNVTNFNIDLSNLDGKCVIDLSANGAFLSQKVPSAASQILNIIINGTTYTPPGGFKLVSDVAAIESWLNGLGLGVFNVSFSNAISGAYINILTYANSNTVTSCYFGISSTSPSVDDSFITTPFQQTNKSLIAFLQAVVDYLCALSDLDVVLSQSQSWSYIDYNGNTVSQTIPSGSTQEVFNAAVANVISTIQSLNTGFENALTRTGNVVRVGGNLTQFTRITYNSYNFQLYKDTDHYANFNEIYTIFINRTGSAVGDTALRVYWDQDKAVFFSATNADIAAVSFLAESIVQADAENKNALIGAFYPYSDNPGVSPAPANDPDKTAYVIASEGRVDYYGKDHVVEGSKMSLGTLLKLKNMTTAERDAIDVSLLEAGLIIFNTTAIKFQGYNGTIWSDLN